jgi:hypothetical protein
VRVVGTEVNATIPPELLKSNPDVRLQVLDQVPNVNGTVGVRERRGNEYPARFAHQLLSGCCEIRKHQLAMAHGRTRATIMVDGSTPLRKTIL